MRYSDPKRITHDNIEHEDRDSGLYIYENRNHTEIYVGSSTQLRHRLKAILYGRADYEQVPEKQSLKEEAVYYKTAYMPIGKARKIEKRKKKDMRFNQL